MNEKPPVFDEEIAKDFEAFKERIHTALNKTQGGTGDTVRICLDIPVEFLSLATWLELHEKRRGLIINGKSEQVEKASKKLSELINMPPIHTHKIHAKNYIYHELWNHFQMEFHELCTNIHPFFYEVEPLPELTPEQKQELKRGIPF